MKRHELLVFVDPDDESVPFWWPALVEHVAHLIIFNFVDCARGGVCTFQGNDGQQYSKHIPR